MQGRYNRILLQYLVGRPPEIGPFTEAPAPLQPRLLASVGPVPAAVNLLLLPFLDLPSAEKKVTLPPPDPGPPISNWDKPAAAATAIANAQQRRAQRDRLARVAALALLRAMSARYVADDSDSWERNDATACLACCGWYETLLWFASHSGGMTIVAMYL